MDLSGEFHLHLTVAPRGAGAVAALERWAAERGLACQEIVLSRGEGAWQPMVTRTGRGTLAEQREAGWALARALAADGFEVVRLKLEAAPGSAGVPRDDAEAAAEPPGRYFEHHVKLDLAPGADLARLERVAEAAGARLSRNDRRRRADGRTERFVTQRCHGVGRGSAAVKLEALLQALAPLGHPVLEVHEEYVAEDSHPGLDAGWAP